MTGSASPAEMTFLDSVNRSFDEAAALVDLPPGLAEEIKNCRSVYYVRFPVKIRGEFRVFHGWRAVHSEQVVLPVELVVQGTLGSDVGLGAFPRIRLPKRTPDAILYE